MFASQPARVRVPIITSECRVKAQRAEGAWRPPALNHNNPMHAASVVLIATALLSTCMWAILLGQLWILRHEFKIAARAPVLVGVCGWSTLVVLSSLFLHWILMVDGKGIPCFVMCLMTYLCEFAYLLYLRFGSRARRARVSWQTVASISHVTRMNGLSAAR